MISVHTSPLEQPGTGDAGGMNVYVDELARQMAERGIEVDIFTRATTSRQPPQVEAAPGVRVNYITAGPFESLTKEELPGQLCAMTAGVMMAEARRSEGFYDLVHSHYWLSGQVGWLVADRWNVPLVHMMHTMAKVKNLNLAPGDTPEPVGRIIGEEQVVAIANRLIANTDTERDELIDLYGADPAEISVVAPGVDLDAFTPGSRAEARRALGLPSDAVVLLFVGRIQPLKAPDVLLRAAEDMLHRDPSLRSKLVVAVLGGPSGTGLASPTGLIDLAGELGIADLTRFHPPVDRATLAQWFRAATVVAVPSHNESFGLVALEAMACGAPVAAARVGGLARLIRDGESGVLIDGHDPRTWSAALAHLIADESRLAALSRGAVERAREFSWAASAENTLAAYRLARAAHLVDIQ
ncbi:D-inositol-3-phosphate glycosyltransferase [Micrococcales bacterium 31B]|nr:D-inositol-3-phosphate glycosyltransferase [Micrococcales bacterium 31B]